jgi:hypothetical protein
MSKDIKTVETPRVHQMVLNCESVNSFGWSEFLLYLSDQGRATLRMPAGWPFDHLGPLTITQKQEWERQNAAIGPDGESPLAEVNLDDIIVQWPSGMENRFEAIDAAVFTGDAFHNEEQRQRFRLAMRRWVRALDEIEDDLAKDA